MTSSEELSVAGFRPFEKRVTDLFQLRFTPSTVPNITFNKTRYPLGVLRKSLSVNTFGNFHLNQ